MLNVLQVKIDPSNKQTDGGKVNLVKDDLQHVSVTTNKHADVCPSWRWAAARCNFSIRVLKKSEIFNRKLNNYAEEKKQTYIYI